jgi:NADPH-dependent glutamate synthase beta subunit-like oxidoreductase/NAD(P)H-flavin reductase
MAVSAENFELGVSGYRFSDLYSPDRLAALNTSFWEGVDRDRPGLRAQFDALPNVAERTPNESKVLIEVAQELGKFIAGLFRIEKETAEIRDLTRSYDPVFRFKNEFLKIRVFKRLEEPAMEAATFAELEKAFTGILLPALSPKEDFETTVARSVLCLQDAAKKLKKEPLSAEELTRLEGQIGSLQDKSVETALNDALKLCEDWCTHKYAIPAQRAALARWASYVRPQKLEFENLVPTVAGSLNIEGHREVAHLRPRDGFKLTDPRMTFKEVLREIDYCLYCHQREKDSCSKGFAEKDGTFKKNPLGIDLKGCPLDERISEMQFLRKEGDPIAALAMIVLDNPMCPGTGHRICNDCMKGCIFQKQTPVNIPENETGILTEVLNLPYGFEIYGLLTRFNPLNKKRPYALPQNGNPVLVVGLGPAGYTLSHYLANDGFGVVGIDALKLEPLDPTLVGSATQAPKPIRSFSELKKELDERILSGFGGVSEYGITVRWDKNFLTLIYLTLLRHPNIRFYGGIRFGGTIDLEDAWRLGFQHVALATGAGRPTLVPMKNSLARGVRKASDFLMSLQLTGAFKKDSLACLQIELPALVIGGGLTALDTATEMLAYYPVQVEKVLTSFEGLVQELGEEKAWNLCDTEEKETLARFLAHGKAVREERTLARSQNRPANFIALCREWGGVNVAYRKRLSDSPAYRLNHEEVMKAFEEGIGFIENVTPVEVVKNARGATQALVCTRSDGSNVTLPARSICVAAGTSPNTIYEREHPGAFELDAKGKFFQKFRTEEKEPGSLALVRAQKSEPGFFLSYLKEGKHVSFYGDNHPDYAGNVVKAMASAKHGAPHVAGLFQEAVLRAEQGKATLEPFKKLTQTLDEKLTTKVVRVNRLTKTIVEVVVHGHFAARKFEPGQFYRLQNFESLAPKVQGHRLTTEALALTGAWVDKEKDLLGMVVLEMGASSKLCATLRPGQPVVVMGPTGAPSDIPKNQTAVLVGGGLGNAVLLSISRALRANGCKVLYFAGYKHSDDIFMQNEIESATDQMVWAIDQGTPITSHRSQDISFKGNIVEAMVAYASGKLGEPLVNFSQVDHLLAIGSDRMMNAVAQARHSVLKPFLNPDHVGVGSINSPMQCMMKEVCAQCLQRHVDPRTGKESVVFSCFNQDQLLDHVDFENLHDRLRVNSLSEKISGAIVDRLLEKERTLLL